MNRWFNYKGHLTHKIESPWPLHFKHSYCWKRQSRSKFASHIYSRNQQSMWMQDGCKAYMDSYMASNGSCFMVTRIIFKNHHVECEPKYMPTCFLNYKNWFALGLQHCLVTQKDKKEWDLVISSANEIAVELEFYIWLFYSDCWD